MKAKAKTKTKTKQKAKAGSGEVTGLSGHFLNPSLNIILLLFLVVSAWRSRVAAPLSALYQRRKR